MKKFLIVPAVLVLLTAASAENRFFLSTGASFLRPADEGFRQIYGNQAIYPEISGAIRLVAGLCLTGSAGRFTRTGTTPNLQLETHASQSYVSAGLSYLLRVSETLCLEAGGGMTSVSYKEEALGTSVSGKQKGYKAEGAIMLVPENERIFLGLRFGYIFAKDTDVSYGGGEPQLLRLGGVRIAFCIGIQLFGSD